MVDRESLPGYLVDSKGLYAPTEFGRFRPITTNDNGDIIIMQPRPLIGKIESEGVVNYGSNNRGRSTGRYSFGSRGSTD